MSNRKKVGRFTILDSPAISDTFVISDPHLKTEGTRGLIPWPDGQKYTGVKSTHSTWVRFDTVKEAEEWLLSQPEYEAEFKEIMKNKEKEISARTSIRVTL